MPKKLLTIGILLGLMIGMSILGGGDDKTLATLGFILLVAYTLGEIVKRVGLPQLVGYIFSGVIFGPHLSRLVFGAVMRQNWGLSADLRSLFGGEPPALFGTDVVESLTLINLLAQGLIGLTAGGELKVPDLKKDFTSILWILGMQTLLVLPAVGGTLYLLATLVPSTLPFLQTGGAVLAAALLFGALAVGTSPSTTLAVITETRAKGPLSTLMLGLIVAKDITTVTLYLIVLSVASSLASGATLSLGELAHHLAVELGGAILLGVIMGALIILYLWLLRVEKMLFIVVLVFTGQWIARQLHAEALLSFIVAGFLVSNFGLVFKRFHEQGEVMIHELERLARPVFVVFFTIAAAKLELAALADYWAVALTYILVRALMLYLSTQAGVKLAKAPKTIQELLWWGVFPQAGVTLTLAGLTTGRIEWSGQFQTIIMSTIFVNIVIGPVLFKASLTKAGETHPEGADEPHGHGHGHAAPAAAQPEAPAAAQCTEEVITLTLPRSAPPGSDRSGPRLARAHQFEEVHFPDPALEHERLNRTLHRLRRRLSRIHQEASQEHLVHRRQLQLDTFQQVVEAVQEVVQHTTRHLARLAAQARAEEAQLDPLEDAPPWADLNKLRALLQGARRDLIEEVTHVVVTEGASSEKSDSSERLLQEVLQKVEKAIETDEEVIVVPQEDSLFSAQEGDGAYVRAVKSLKRALRPLGVARTRAVAVALLSRYHVGLPMPPQLLSTSNLMGSQRLYTWRKVRILYHLADQIFAEALQFLEDQPASLAQASAETLQHDMERLGEQSPPHSLPHGAEEGERPSGTEIQALEDALRAEALAVPLKPTPSRELLVQKLSAFFSDRLQDFQEDCALAQRDIAIYADDIDRRFLLAMVTPFRHLSESFQKAGTFELSVRDISPAALFEDYRARRLEIMTAVRNWRTLSQGFAGSIALELEISRVEVRLREILQRTLRDIDRELLSTLSYHAAEFSERVVETQHRVDQELHPGAEPEAIRKMINRERALLVGFVHDSALADIQELRDSRRFSRILESLMSDLRLLADEGPAVISVSSQDAIKLGDGAPLGEVTLLEVPLREILHEVLEREVAVQLSDVELRLMGLIERASAEVLEIGRIVAFNLEAAAGELQAPGEVGEWVDGEAEAQPWRRRSRRSRQPRLDREGRLTEAGVALPLEFAVGGLTRARERLEGLNETIVAEGGGIEESLRQETVRPLLRVHELVADGDPGVLKRYLFQREVAGEVSKRTQEPGGALRRAGDRLAAFYKERLRPMREEVAAELSSTRAAHGRDYQPDHVAARVAEAIADVWEREDLPEIYRRLFSPTPTELADFFVPRPEVLTSFQSAARRWLEGHPTTIAVLGETGAGRTSFINYALHTTLDGMPTVRRSLKRTITDEAALIEELSAISGGREQSVKRLQLRMSNRQERTVIVIEEAENLFLRSLDGLRPLRRFLSLIGQTSGSALWVLSMSEHAWAWLETVLHISDHFTHLLHLRALNRAEIENVVMTRHRVSGYQLRFDQRITATERLRLRARAWLEGREDNDLAMQLQQRYFDRLHELSRGNPMLGIYHWLRSVSQIEGEGSVLRVRPVEPIDLSVLHELDHHKLLTLAFTLQHHGLTIAEFSQVFRVSEDEARAGLVHLTHMGLLFIDPGEEDCYRIHRVLQRPIAEILQSRNML